MKKHFIAIVIICLILIPIKAEAVIKDMICMYNYMGNSYLFFQQSVYPYNGFRKANYTPNNKPDIYNSVWHHDIEYDVENHYFDVPWDENERYLTDCPKNLGVDDDLYNVYLHAASYYDDDNNEYTPPIYMNYELYNQINKKWNDILEELNKEGESHAGESPVLKCTYNHDDTVVIVEQDANGKLSAKDAKYGDLSTKCVVAQPTSIDAIIDTDKQDSYLDKTSFGTLNSCPNRVAYSENDAHRKEIVLGVGLFDKINVNSFSVRTQSTTAPTTTRASNMSEMLDICESSGTLQIIYVAKIIFSFICYMVPLLLTIILSIDISKVVTDPQAVKKVLEVGKKRIIIGLLLVFTPTIVKLLITSLGGDSDLNRCYTNANPSHIEGRKEYEKEYFNGDRKHQSTRGSSKTRTTITRINVETGFHIKEFTTNDNFKISYIINVPENATSGKPLIIFLHGDLSKNDPDAIAELVHIKYIKNNYDNQYPFVYLVPITPGTSWYHNNNTLSTLQELFNYIIDKYDIDKKNVIITGHSRGAVGLWYVVGYNPGMFSAAVPLSCGYDSPPPIMSSFKGVYVCAKIEASGQRCSESDLRVIIGEVNGKGGRGYFEKVNGYNHGSILELFKRKELYMWMMHPDGTCPNYNK